MKLIVNIRYALLIMAGITFLTACNKDDKGDTGTGPAVSTFAGSGSAGSADNSSAVAATFNHPQGVVVDATGNIYVADAFAHKIRKITTGGVVTTFAGSGQAGGFDTTIASLATFNGPTGLAIDTAGNLIVADAGGNKIRRITPAGVVTTVAGTGVGSAVEGARTVATFLTPTGVAVDKSGIIYVADYGNHKIRRITTAGTVSTFAGAGIALPGRLDGTGTGATFYYPFGIAIDTTGNLYVTDSYTAHIRKITPAAVVTTIAGGTTIGNTDGTGTGATFSSPFGIAVSASGNIYVADSRNQKIRKITPAGVVTTLAGSGNAGSNDAPATAASFYLPHAVALDVAGNVYVADAGNNKIRKIAGN